MILGLDLSTSISGITVLSGGEQRLLHCSFCDTKKEKDFFKKVDLLKKDLEELRENFDIKHIYIEKNLTAFLSRRTSANTLFKLAKFNGIISYLCREIFKLEPNYLAASSARKKCGITIQRSKDTKAQILRFFLDEEPTVVLDLKRTGRPKDHMFDMADSYVIALAGLKCTKEKNEK